MAKIPCFVIDTSVLKNMFDGSEDSDGKKMLKKLKEIKDSGKNLFAFATKSCFLRAIYLSDPETSINNIQKTLGFLKVVNDDINFMDEKAVLNGVLTLANSLSQGIKK